MNQSLAPINHTLGGNAAMAADLQKALTVGYPNMAGNVGSALQTQSLDPVVLNLCYQISDLALRQKLPVKTVNSTVQQYAELTKYGVGGASSSFMPEIGTPQPSDGVVVPRYTVLKHMGRQGAVSFAAMQTAAGSIVEPLAFETRNLVMRILQDQEELHFVGNSTLSPLQYDGFITQILARAPTRNIRDLRGQALNQDLIMDASAVVGDKPTFGTLTDLFINTQCKGDLGRQLIAQQRNIVSNAAQGGTILGLDPEGVRGTKGIISLHACPFLSDGGSPAPGPTGLPQFAPAAPTISNVSAAAPTGGVKSQFTTSADVGDVSYVVVASSSQGDSAPVFVTPGATTAVQNGQVVKFTITPGAGNPAEFFSIYRTRTNSPSTALDAHMLIQRVPNTIEGIPQTGPSTITDSNAKLPGTYDAVAFDFSPNMENQVLLQTGPMARIPMGIQQTAFQFMVTHTLAPQLKAPSRAFLWQNVGLLPSLPTAF